MNYLKNGWPSKNQISSEILPYYARQASLSISGECIIFGDRVVIPDCFQKQILQRLHQDHPGQYRMKSLARSFVYWPNIDQQIEEFVRNCTKCIESSKAPIRVPLHPWKYASGPWTRIHIDFAGPLYGLYYLITIDAYSKWPEIHSTNTITAAFTIDTLADMFSRYGNPKTIVSDNGTQFSSSAFQHFCNERGISHIRTAPYHPQSNGQAERFVDTFKRAFKKCEGRGETLHKHIMSFLTTYRATPNRSAPDGKCPSELFIGRRIRTTLDLLLPPTPQPVLENTDQQYTVQQYNRKHGVKPKSFAAGDAVYVQIHKANKAPEWTSGKVIERIGKVMYNIFINQQRRNQLIRAHVDQMKSSSNAQPSQNQQSSTPNIFLDIFEIQPHPTPIQQVEPNTPASSPQMTEADTPASAPLQEPIPEQRVPRQRRAPAHLRDYELF